MNLNNLYNFENIARTFSDAIFGINSRGIIIYCNPAVKPIYGYEVDELIGQSYNLLLPDHFRNEFSEMLDKCNGNLIPGPVYSEKLCRNKSIRKISAHYSPICSEEGTVIGLTCIDRKSDRILAIENKAQSLLETAPDAMVIVDGNGTIRLVNTQTEKIFGYRRNEMVGKNVEILLPHRFKDSHHQNRIGFFNNPKVRPMGEGSELFGRRKDGQEFPVEISLSPLKTKVGMFVSAAIRDISERTYIKELESKNRELEQFAYIASHDLQEPLDTISSFILLLEEYKKEDFPPDFAEYIGYIKSSSERLRLLITGLLEYSRLGKKSKVAKVDCNLIIKEVMQDISSAIKNSNAVFKIDQLPVINGYPVEIRLLFQNLISNAIKFRKKEVEPFILITCTEVEKLFTFCISDNGIGIDEKYKDKIFVIFQRLHSDHMYKGSGIGLAHCKKIVELHNGNIWLESVPGKGSKFFFTIPNNKQDP